MPARKKAARPIEPVTATVSIDGREFPFLLWNRRLRLGEAVEVDYYWMDVSDLGTPGSKNTRSCIEHRRAAMRLMGWDDDPHEQVRYLAARCYPPLASGKAVHSIYRHARLGPNFDDPSAGKIPEAISLPDDAVARIDRAVAGRDIAGVRRELDEVLEWRGPAGVAETKAFHEEFVPRILGALDALRLGDEEGVDRALAAVTSELGRRRRRGGIGPERHFLNMFEYEVKTSFYLCYANAWVDLVPWLREHRGLDPAGERFLRFWHHQNQPLEGGPDGLADPRAAFSGQVLALHPASAFFMHDPSLLEFAGRYFGTEAARPWRKPGEPTASTPTGTWSGRSWSRPTSIAGSTAIWPAVAAPRRGPAAPRPRPMIRGLPAPPKSRTMRRSRSSGASRPAGIAADAAAIWVTSGFIGTAPIRGGARSTSRAGRVEGNPLSGSMTANSRNGHGPGIASTDRGRAGPSRLLNAVPPLRPRSSPR